MKDKDDISSILSEFTSIATEYLNSKYEEINDNSLCKLAFFNQFKGENLFLKRFIHYLVESLNYFTNSELYSIIIGVAENYTMVH